MQATAGLSARHLAPSSEWLQASLQAAVRMTAPKQFAQAAVDGQAPQPRTPSELRAASASGSGTQVYEIVNEAGRGLLYQVGEMLTSTSADQVNLNRHNYIEWNIFMQQVLFQNERVQAARLAALDASP